MRWLACFSLVVAGVGCNTVGPPALEGGRLDYNEVIAHTWNEQLLRNLVRLRYRDTLLFLEITGVSTQYSAQYSLGASPSFSSGNEPSLGVNTGVSFSERPTITYSPLQGQEFVTQLLSPIPLDALVLLSQSGWSIERVLRMCAQEMNRLDNAASASGPTPTYAPDDEKFREAVELMRSLQKSDQLNGHVRTLPGTSDKYFVFSFAASGSGGGEAARLRGLLGLDDAVGEVPIVDGWAVDQDGTLAIQMRSMLGVLHFLSNAVDVPTRDEGLGLVVTTKNADQTDFDWASVVGDLLKISWAEERPRDAFVTTHYRGKWYYIDDADLNSKATFGLLTYLFYLQAGDIQGFGPTLTLPIGQ